MSVDGSPRATRVMMLWWPDWTVHAAESAADPLILTARGKVVACSRSARGLGVDPGQRVREAQLRCPEATVLPHDPEREVQEFAPVLRAIETVVPGVHVVRPGLAAVRAQGARRFYGSEHLAAQALLHGVQDRVGGLPAGTIRVAVADGLFAAEHIAYTTTSQSPLAIVRPGDQQRFLERLPVDALSGHLEESSRMPMLLRRMGVRHLNDLARMRRPDVHARFGADGLRAHQLACGEDADRLQPQPAPRDHGVRIDLAEGTVRADHVLTQCADQVAALVEALTGQSLVCHEVRLSVTVGNAETYSRRWRHPRHFDTADLLDRLSWQLRDLAGGDGHEMTRVCLEPTEVASAASEAIGLWGERPEDRVRQALAGLQKTLGPSGVLSATVAGGRLLEERRVLRPWGDALPTRRERRLDQPWPGALPGPAPATVFTDRRPVDVLTSGRQPVGVGARGEIHGLPAWLRLHTESRSERRITAWAGPWPVHQRWWHASGARVDRLQLVDEHDQAWLVLTDDRGWRAEALYD